MGRGEVAGIVVWRLDRLGRTASGLTALFDELLANSINLISIKDGIDLKTPAGRLMANVLASVAQFETEVRGERVRNGIAAARKKGKRWGGSQPGVPKKVKPKHRRDVETMRSAKVPVATIARAVGLSRSTIYKMIEELEASK
jgi:DNA invertase Pin-like site-specific DNA recombinase